MSSVEEPSDAATDWPRVLVVGGSIGGLTVAALLRDLGCDVDVYERSSVALKERGTGIVVLPVTERYFTERGGDDERVSLELTYWTYVDRTGGIISADEDHFRFSAWNTLYRALLDAFDADRYHLDSEMVGFEQSADGVTLHLAGGRRVEGDLLVCSDGLSSTARSLLLPDVAPEYAGYVAWRGTLSENRLSTRTREDLRDAMLYQVLDRSHILAYAIPDEAGSTEPGTRLINWVWYRNYPDDGTLTDLMTGTDGQQRIGTMPPGMVRPRFLEDLHRTVDVELAPNLAELVLTTERPMIQAIFDLESPQMVFGRVCVMGDAAFGVRPHVAAGQAKACADGWALRDAIERAGGNLDEALSSWEPTQLELGRRVVERSRQMGTRAQFANTMVPGDPTWKFGLWEPGN
jgi:2,6-dihydroxypyridine 3-monooxygenase